VALVWMSQTRSMERNAVLFGYSLPRIIVGIVFFCLVVAVLALTAGGFFRRRWFRAVHRAAERWVEGDAGRPLYLALVLFATALLAGYVLALFKASFVPTTPYLLRLAVDRTFPGLAWLGLVAAQLAVFLGVHYAGLRRRRTLMAPGTGTAVLLTVLLTGAFAQWLTFALRAEWLYKIPGWFYVWRRTPQSLLPSLAYLAPVTIVTVIAVWGMLRAPQSRSRNLAGLMIVFSILQVAFGIARGGGIEELRLKYANSPLSIQTQYACEAESVTAVFSDYEDKYGDTFWLGTKPPGFLSFYVGFRDVLRWILPQLMEAACFRTMTGLYAVFFPLLASIVLLPMRGLEEEWGTASWSPTSGLLYVAIPGAVLIPMILDQSLFPLVSTACVLATVRAVRSSSVSKSVVAGALASLALILSFSLLPLLGFALAYPLLDALSRGERMHLRRLAGPAVAFVAGCAIVLVLARLALDYDPVARYQAAFLHHRAIKDFSPSTGGVLGSILLNNVEVLHLFGFPLVLLFCVQCIRSANALRARRYTGKDAFVLAVVVTYVGLNLIGQTRGEVARLWLFFLPLMCVVAAEGAHDILRSPSRSLLWLLVLGLVSTALAHWFLFGGRPV